MAPLRYAWEPPAQVSETCLVSSILSTAPVYTTHLRSSSLTCCLGDQSIPKWLLHLNKHKVPGRLQSHPVCVLCPEASKPIQVRAVCLGDCLSTVHTWEIPSQPVILVSLGCWGGSVPWLICKAEALCLGRPSPAHHLNEHSIPGIHWLYSLPWQAQHTWKYPDQTILVKIVWPVMVIQHDYDALVLTPAWKQQKTWGLRIRGNWKKEENNSTKGLSPHCKSQYKSTFL